MPFQQFLVNLAKMTTLRNVANKLKGKENEANKSLSSFSLTRLTYRRRSTKLQIPFFLSHLLLLNRSVLREGSS